MGCGTSCSSFLKSSRESALYHRFWHGYQRPDLKTADFETKLNDEFFPLYPPSVEYGLVAYNPVLPVRTNPTDPAEWALVTYSSKDQYEKFKLTELGRQSAAAHWDVFDKTKSRSIVIEEYKGKAETDHAYITNLPYSDFSKAKIHFALYKADRLDEVLKAIDKNHGVSKKILQNIAFAVSDGLIAEYLFFSPTADPSRTLPTLNADQVIILQDGVPGKIHVREGQGLKAKL